MPPASTSSSIPTPSMARRPSGSGRCCRTRSRRWKRGVSRLPIAGYDARRWLRSEERADRADHVVRFVDLVDELPAVEGGAGVRDAEGEKVADPEGRFLRNFDVGMLVIEGDDGAEAAGGLRRRVRARAI